MDLFNITKRLIDIVGSIFGIILFSPILLVGAIWVKIVSPRGLVFANPPPRVGKNKVPFKLLKFRSMIPNAHDWMKSQPELWKKYLENDYKLDPDPRLLPGAKILRKFSIDEIPQFINILKGEMSLVGPRAYYFFEVENQLKKHPKSKRYIEEALGVKPGLTGPWQVGGRSEIGFADRVKMDAQYAKRHSILYDLLIILKTPLAVLMAKGAY